MFESLKKMHDQGGQETSRSGNVGHITGAIAGGIVGYGLAKELDGNIGVYAPTAMFLGAYIGDTINRVRVGYQKALRGNS